jgi:hypothetical protein
MVLDGLQHDFDQLQGSARTPAGKVDPIGKQGKHLDFQTPFLHPGNILEGKIVVYGQIKILEQDALDNIAVRIPD